MATANYRPDPYQGWRVISPACGNITVHQLMTDTSGRWACVLDLGCYRIYRE